jgi:GDPmannose 4,6-dehydratase
MKTALILGVTGQDGSYMAELLIKKKYRVFGLYRKAATSNTSNIDHLINDKKIFNKNFFLIGGDLLDTNSIFNAIQTAKPKEIYNFADQDHVRWSFTIPSYSFSVTTIGVLNVLESIRQSKLKIKYFQPTSSNMFGNTNTKSQNEKTEFQPMSIYALGKVSAYHLCKMYNQIYGMSNCGTIFYNHESPRRSKEYVTKKIVKAVCRISQNKQKLLTLGDIDQGIDWGYAKDYVEASWKIMQLKKPDFYVIGSGKLVTVRSFTKKCFQYFNLDYKNYIKIDKKLLRPSKTSNLKANYSKAKKEFGYKPKTNIDKLIKIMIEEEIKKLN